MIAWHLKHMLQASAIYLREQDKKMLHKNHPKPKAKCSVMCYILYMSLFNINPTVEQNENTQCSRL